MFNMRVIARKPKEDYVVKQIDNTLEALQEFVCGYIETVWLFGDVVVICNEEGRIHGLPYNCTVDGISFVGPILIVGAEGDEFCDLSEEFIEDLDRFTED